MQRCGFYWQRPIGCLYGMTIEDFMLLGVFVIQMKLVELKVNAHWSSWHINLAITIKGRKIAEIKCYLCSEFTWP